MPIFLFFSTIEKMVRASVLNCISVLHRAIYREVAAMNFVVVLF